MRWHSVYHPISWGGPLRWVRQLWCIDGKYYGKAAIRAKIDSGEWLTPLTDHILDRCCEVAQYNIASRNADDIIDQKNLWLKMLKEPTGYSVTEFALGLNHSSLTHKGATPLACNIYDKLVRRSPRSLGFGDYGRRQRMFPERRK